MENSRDVSVGDLIYGSDAYYGQVTRVGGSVVEFTTVGLMPAGPKGDQGNQGPRGLTGPQGPQGIPGEVQIKDLPGYNFAMPDFVGKTEISTGLYRLYNTSGITVDYNVNSGNFIINGTAADGRFIYLTDLPIIQAGQTVSRSTYYVSGSINIIDFSINFTLGMVDSSKNDMYINYSNIIVQNTITTSSTDSRRLILYITNGRVFDNFTFKLQVEKGSQATSYTVPGQIPQYSEQFALRQQEEWITPTLLNGATGTLQYMKDTLGFVHIEGTITSINSELS